jgi:flagellar biosynthesis protein FlhA
MPGKQMAIDADLNAGLITDEQAKARRAEVSAEADFYGAMDGASKFVKGDAIAGIVILVINLVGGVVIGMAMHGMPIMESLSTYAILTIGDGLVTQIPALLMAVATGMIVTRSNADSDMGSEASGQLSQSRNALMIAGVAAIALALIPGMPKLPFLLIGAGLVFMSQRIKAGETAAAKAAELEAQRPPEAVAETPEDLIAKIRVQPIEILLSPDLVDLVTGASDDLLARVRGLRRKVGMDLGFVIPPVNARDSVELPPHTYVIRIAGVEAGRGEAPAGNVLALGDALDALPGIATMEPVFGLAGKWVPAAMAHSAQMTGATVIDRVSVVVTHLSSIVTANAARLLSREDVRVLTESVKEESPSAVEELIPNLLSLAEVQRVLQGLLEEEVPINDLARIYEALTLRAKISTDPEGLIEAARRALGPVPAIRHVDGGRLNVIMIEPGLEQTMLEGLRPSENGSQILMDANRIEAILGSLQQSTVAAQDEGRSVVLVCAPLIRPAVRRLVSARTNGLPVLSYQEAQAANAAIETIGVVRGAEQVSA